MSGVQKESSHVATWRVWLPVLVWVVIAVGLTQTLVHLLFMDLNMVTYHIYSGIIQALLILVPASLYVLWRDTARRERAALAELQRSEQLRKDLTAMLVHDLKNPVISAAMGLELVLESENRDDMPALQEEMLVRARATLRRLEEMVGDIFALSLVQAGELPLQIESIDLCDLIAEVVADTTAQANQRGIELSAPDLCEVPDVEADYRHVRRVLENLVANAIAHTPRGGRVEVSVSEGEQELVASVTDTGEGIDEDLGEELFDLYTQGPRSAPKGRASAGLGLAFCKLAVEAHGGRIYAESAPGGGSRFSFTLPLMTGR